MKTRLLSVLLVFLLLASVSIPAVSAIPVANANPAVCLAPLIPPVADVIIGSVTVVMTGAAALEIAKFLGKTWDNTQEGWKQLLKDTGEAINSLFTQPNWVRITTPEGQTLMQAFYDCYTATSGSGGKKDDKWYFEARRNHGKIEINTKRMDETQAVKEMGRGKDIMTLTEKMAKDLVGKFRGLSKEATDDLRFEGDHNPADGFLHHLHYEAHNMRLHCWSWK